MEAQLSDFSPTLSCTGICQTDSSQYVLQLTYACQYDVYTWDLYRTVHQVHSLHQHIAHYLATAGQLPVTPPLSPALFTSISLKDQQTAIEAYLQGLLSRPDILQIDAVLEFLEVSSRSFDGTSSKHKEGYVFKRTGGRHGNEARMCYCGRFFRRFQRRWLLLRDYSISYMVHRRDKTLQETLPLKGCFRLFAGKEDTGYEDGIRVETSHRWLLFRAGSVSEMRQWQEAIQQAAADSPWTSSPTNPYHSSFPVRSHCQTGFFIDGKRYFKALYEALLEAKRDVFIAGFWVCPELYLLRPADQHPESQLVEVLGRLADRGVRVCVSLYREVKFTLLLDSLYTKKVLKKRNSSIRVIRHPCRSVTGGEFLWAHHEKLVCIDQEVAFLGGFDLAYGRWDNSHHSLFDSDKLTWPGIDYYNCYIQDFEDVQRVKRDSINRQQTPRMPWHDVGVRVTGKVAADAALHFIELWNHIMTDVTTTYRRRKSLLQPAVSPSNIDVFDEFPTRPPVRLLTIQPSKRCSTETLVRPSDVSSDEEVSEDLVSNEEEEFERGLSGTQEVQLVRSAGPWSLGVSLETSVHLAYLHLIDQADHFVYIENQFFISSTGGDFVCNQVAQALVERIKLAASHNERFRVIVVLPLLPGFQGSIDSPSAALMRIELHWEYQTICRGANSILTQLQADPKISDPLDYIQFYGLRTHGQSPLGVPATEAIYVHSKLMITDDSTAIIGSANVNDRSLLGNRDSEIAVVVRDSNKVSSRLGGQTVKVSASVLDLRLRLFQEFSGCEDIESLRDPLSPQFAETWDEVAKRNTRFYRETFGCAPDDRVRRMSDLSKQTCSEYDPTAVTGFLVEWPLHFLEQENLQVTVFNKEYFAPDENFT